MTKTLFGLVDALRGRADALWALMAPVWGGVAWIAGTSLVSLLFVARGTLADAGLIDAAPAPELVVVELDEVFAEHYDYPKETPKAYLAEVIRTVAQHEPRVVVLDYWFTNADLSAPGFDAIVAAVAEAPASVRFVFPTRLLQQADGPIVLDVPPTPLRRHVLTGYAGLRGDPVLEQQLTARVAGGEVAPSLAMAALAAWTAPDVVAEAEAFVDAAADSPALALPLETWQATGELLAASLDASTTATGGWQAVLDVHGVRAEDADAYGINHRDHFGPGAPGVLASEGLVQGTLPPAFLNAQVRDRLVVIGSTYPLKDDTFGTPFGDRRGVLVHAATLHSLLAERPLTHVGWGWSLAAALGTALLAMGLVWLLSPRAVLVVGALLVLGYGVAFAAAFLGADLLLPLAWPLVGGAVGLHLAHWDPIARRVRRVGAPLDLRLRLAFVEGDGAEDGGWPLDRRVLVRAEGPSDTWEVGEARLRSDVSIRGKHPMAHALTAVARGTTDASLRAEVGATLFATLCPGDAAEVYRAAQRRAAARPLRLRLRLEDPALAVVPWGMAYDPEAKTSVAGLTAAYLVHEVATSAPEATLEHGGDVGLVVWETAGAAGQGASSFDQMLLSSALEESPHVVRRSWPPSPEERAPYLLHLIGHSRLCDGEARWDLTETDAVDAAALAQLIRARRVPSLIALDSVRPSGDPADIGTAVFAARLATQLGCAVVMVPSPVSDTGRQVFWETFYAEAKRGSLASFAHAVEALAEAEPGAAGLVRCIRPVAPEDSPE
ncbi:MAG: CHASE2 domain-containing protein [Bacteroidota bacterium]